MGDGGKKNNNNGSREHKLKQPKIKDLTVRFALKVHFLSLISHSLPSLAYKSAILDCKHAPEPWFSSAV